MSTLSSSKDSANRPPCITKPPFLKQQCRHILMPHRALFFPPAAANRLIHLHFPPYALSVLESVKPHIHVNQSHGVSREAMSELISSSMSTRVCGDPKSEACRNEAAALPLKLGAIGVILIAGVLGVAIPLFGKKRRFLTTDGNLFVVAKAFAAGVILATGFVHMLPDGAEALTNRCLPRWPWAKFPFAEFLAMLASLGTLFVEFVGTQFYERKHADDRRREREEAEARAASHEQVESGIVPAANWNEGDKVFAGEGGGEGMHIVGMHAHAAAHRHSHPHGRDSCEGHFRKPGHVGHAHAAAWGEAEEEEGPSSHVRHVIVSQVLELGIVSHSVIIGLSLGVSQSPCTIRPLMGALAFHQFFEGFALGGCISQAKFKTSSATLMACFFAMTTPAGIGIGTAVSSFYNPNSPRALVVEGLFDSISAGILVYMALVDLIAADFLSRRMSCNLRLQAASYLALFLGAASMSLLAIWA